MLKKIAKLVQGSFGPAFRRLRASLGQPGTLHQVGLMGAALLAGLAAVGYTTLFRLAEKFSNQLFHNYPYAILLVTPVTFAGSWFIVYRWARYAAGSGIPQVMAAVELDPKARAVAYPRLLGWRVLVAKIASSVLCVMGGGVVGREGPTLQVSASIFYLVGRFFQRFTKLISLDLWILGGAAAGIAAAFNTPLGGVVYAIEELAQHHFNRIRFVVLMAVLIAGLVAQMLLGSYLYLGYPQIGTVSFADLPAAIVIGFVGALIGALFGQLLVKSQRWIRERAADAVLVRVVLLCSLIVVFLGLTNRHALGPGNQLISEILSGKVQGTMGMSAARFVSMSASYLAGGAGGIFAPSLALGASVGSWMASFWQGLNPVLLSLLGMIAVLTGVTRAPLTSFVLILEMTDRHSAIFPMMVTALAASAGARLISPTSFYEQTKAVILKDLERSTESKEQDARS
ncbi:MAG: chloride channel protein [Pseudomonadota bacterium]